MSDMELTPYEDGFGPRQRLLLAICILEVWQGQGLAALAVILLLYSCSIGSLVSVCLSRSSCCLLLCRHWGLHQLFATQHSSLLGSVLTCTVK